MSTSLARQLQRLQSDVNRGKGRASFLFHAREAADYDTATIFGIGCNGLEELVTLDNSFERFTNDLFSTGWMELDREHSTLDVNENINALVSDFCRTLSPYFALRAAHKTLEWLIRRFKVHVYNVDALMECALPHHDTVHFGRLVQLLPIGSTSTTLGDGSMSLPLWHFLAANQKNGVPLPKEVLVRQCLKDAAVVSFICKTAANAVEHESKSLGKAKSTLTWYTITLTEAITRAGNAKSMTLTEETVSALIPHLLQGIRDTNNLDYQAASYLIVSALLAPGKASLYPQVFAPIVNSIAVSANIEKPRYAITCLATVFAGQVTHHDEADSSNWFVNFVFSNSATRNLLRLTDVGRILYDLGTDRVITSFVRSFLNSVIAYAATREDVSKTLRKIIQSIPIVTFTPIATSVIQSLINAYLTTKQATNAPVESNDEKKRSSKSRDLSKALNGLGSILSVFGLMYPDLLDQCLRTYTQNPKNSEHAKSVMNWVGEILNNSNLVSAKPMEEDETSNESLEHHSLRSALSHASTIIREKAAVQVSRDAQALIALLKGKTFRNMENVAAIELAAQCASKLTTVTYCLSRILSDPDEAVVTIGYQTHIQLLRNGIFALSEQNVEEELSKTLIEMDEFDETCKYVPPIVSFVSMFLVQDLPFSAVLSKSVFLLHQLCKHAKTWGPLSATSIEAVLQGAQKTTPESGNSNDAAIILSQEERASLLVTAGARNLICEILTLASGPLAHIFHNLRKAQSTTISAADQTSVATSIRTLTALVLSILPIGKEGSSSGKDTRTYNIAEVGQVAVTNVKAKVMNIMTRLSARSILSDSFALFAYFRPNLREQLPKPHTATLLLTYGLLADFHASKESSIALQSLLHIANATSGNGAAHQRARDAACVILDSAMALAYKAVTDKVDVLALDKKSDAFLPALDKEGAFVYLQALQTLVVPLVTIVRDDWTSISSAYVTCAKLKYIQTRNFLDKRQGKTNTLKVYDLGDDDYDYETVITSAETLSISPLGAISGSGQEAVAGGKRNLRIDQAWFDVDAFPYHSISAIASAAMLGSAARNLEEQALGIPDVRKHVLSNDTKLRARASLLSSMLTRIVSTLSLLGTQFDNDAAAEPESLLLSPPVLDGMDYQAKMRVLFLRLLTFLLGLSPVLINWELVAESYVGPLLKTIDTIFKSIGNGNILSPSVRVLSVLAVLADNTHPLVSERALQLIRVYFAIQVQEQKKDKQHIALLITHVTPIALAVVCQASGHPSVRAQAVALLGEIATLPEPENPFRILRNHFNILTQGLASLPSDLGVFAAQFHKLAVLVTAAIRSSPPDAPFDPVVPARVITTAVAPASCYGPGSAPFKTQEEKEYAASVALPFATALGTLGAIRAKLGCRSGVLLLQLASPAGGLALMPVASVILEYAAKTIEIEAENKVIILNESFLASVQIALALATRVAGDIVYWARKHNVLTTGQGAHVVAVPAGSSNAESEEVVRKCHELVVQLVQALHPLLSCRYPVHALPMTKSKLPETDDILASGNALVQSTIKCIGTTLWGLSLGIQQLYNLPNGPANLIFSALINSIMYHPAETATVARTTLCRLRLPAPIVLDFFASEPTLLPKRPSKVTASTESEGSRSYKASYVLEKVQSLLQSHESVRAWIKKITLISEIILSAIGSDTTSELTAPSATVQVNKGGVANSHLLIPVLFDLLAVTAALGIAVSDDNARSALNEGEEQDLLTSIQYNSQLLLACAHHAVAQLATKPEIKVLAAGTAAAAAVLSTASGAAPSLADIEKKVGDSGVSGVSVPEYATAIAAMDIDLPIHFVKTTDSTQTRGAGLLLLSSLATAVPAAVLTRILPLLTSIGEVTVAREDAYSLAVLSRLVEAVVLPLRTHGSALGVTPEALIKVFTSQVRLIPHHRQRALFVSLLSTLAAPPVEVGPAAPADKSQYLPATSALLLMQHTVGGKEVEHDTALEGLLPEYKNKFLTSPIDSDETMIQSTDSTVYEISSVKNLVGVPGLVSELFLPFHSHQQTHSLACLLTVARHLLDVSSNLEDFASTAPSNPELEASMDEDDLDVMDSQTELAPVLSLLTSTYVKPKGEETKVVSLSQAQRAKVGSSILQFVHAMITSKEFVLATLSVPTMPASQVLDETKRKGRSAAAKLQRQQLFLAEQLFDLLHVALESGEKTLDARAKHFRMVKALQAELATSNADSSSKKAKINHLNTVIHSLTALIRFWKKITERVYDILHSLTAILAPASLVAVMAALLQNSNLAIRRRSLLFLNYYLHSTQGSPTANSIAAQYGLPAKPNKVKPTDVLSDEGQLFLHLLPDLDTIIKNAVESRDHHLDEHDASNVQVALDSVAVLATYFAKGKFASHFTASLETSLTLAARALPKDNTQHLPLPIKGSAILCASQICSAMGPSSLPILTRLMPSLLDTLEWTLSREALTWTTKELQAQAITATSLRVQSADDDLNDVEALMNLDATKGGEEVGALRLACLVALRLLFTSVAPFLSRYLGRVITALSEPVSLGPLPPPRSTARVDRRIALTPDGTPTVTPLSAMKKRSTMPRLPPTVDSTSYTPATLKMTSSTAQSCATIASETLNLLVQSMEARLTLSSLLSTWTHANRSTTHSHSSVVLAASLTSLFSRLSRADVRNALPSLQQHAFQALDFRWVTAPIAVLSKLLDKKQNQITPEEISALHQHAIDASHVEHEVIIFLTSVALRLGDKTLRPFLLKLLQWADSTPEDIAEEAELNEYPLPEERSTDYWLYAALSRKITFARFLEALIVTAKTAFAPYLIMLFPEVLKNMENLIASVLANSKRSKDEKSPAAGSSTLEASGGIRTRSTIAAQALGDGGLLALQAQKRAGSKTNRKEDKKSPDEGTGSVATGSKRSRSEEAPKNAKKRVRFGDLSDESDSDSHTSDNDLSSMEDSDNESIRTAESWDSSDSESDSASDFDCESDAEESKQDEEPGPETPVLAFERLFGLDATWNPAALHDFVTLPGAVSPPFSVVPTTPYALLCSFLGVLLASTSVDAQAHLIKNPGTFLSGKPGRDRLATIVKILPNLYALPLALHAKEADKDKNDKNVSFLLTETSDLSSYPFVLATPGIPNGPTGYSTFVNAYLIPLVASLVPATHSDVAWKSLNHALLMLTRDTRARVRLAALNSVSALFKAGDIEALVLLPETLPFLAELQHDGDGEIEAAAHATINQLEIVAGEDLSKYLS